MNAGIVILLPVHNRKEISRGFVECLKVQTFTEYHLVLIDDGSTDGTAEMVSEYIPSATVLRGSGNWWWAGSLQQGVNWLKKQDLNDDTLVLFINDDVSFFPDYLERAMTVMKGKRGSLVLSRYFTPESNEIVETGVFADWRRLSFDIADSAERINCLSSRGLFAYWQDICVIGGFYPILLPHYGSDSEYSHRAHKKGFKCETSAELVIIPNHETTGYHALDDQNFIKFLKKYFSKRSSNNPVYWSIFILLSSDLIWVLPNLARIWVRSANAIINKCLASRN